jgi:hypothetical protein
MHVLLIGHAQIKSFQDPELPTAYDRYQLKINDKAAALVREAADAVLFARFETELVKVSGKARARGEGVRVMYSESRPAFDAKNRFNLPFCMPLDWKTFGDAIRTFYGLHAKGSGAGKDKKHPAQKDAPQSPERPLLAKMREQLNQSKISELEFPDILKAAQIPEAQSEATSLESIPDKPLILSLESWDTVVALAEELRTQKAEASA